MDYFPAFLDLNDRRCLVVGGGAIALRKVRLLSDAGASLTIVAPEVCDDLRVLAAEYKHQILERVFHPDDVSGQWLVVSASGDPAVESAVFERANAAGVFCNGVDDKANCSYITPAIVDRSPIVVAISSGGAAPVLARKLRAQIETLLPFGIADLGALARDWRGQAKSVFEDILSRRRFWERVFDGRAATLAANGDIAAADAEIDRLMHDSGNHSRGEAWLVGAGPGDPGLLTIKALQAMQTADVILYDRLVSRDVLKLARRDADLISVGKTPGSALNSQDEINTKLVELVAAGKRVCRLKGGDPFIFGRGGEEAEALWAAGFSCEVVPGITAAAGCAASAGIPLTHRDWSQSVTFVTAHGKDSVDSLDWAALARGRQTLAFYMAVRRFPDLMNRLVAQGRSADTPVAIIEKGTTPEQRVIRGALGQLTLLAEAHQITSPAMLLVGEVAALGKSRTNGEDVRSEKWRVEPHVQGIYDKPEFRIANKGKQK